MYREALPDKVTKKWQVTVDLMKQFFDVPAALINRFIDGRIQIEVSGVGDKVYFKKGDSSKAGTGHYCDEVFATGEQVYIKNASKGKKWASTPDSTKGMVSYLGSPLRWPDKSIFGTLCVLDLVERDYDAKYLALIDQFRLIIESDLLSLADELRQNESMENSEKRYRLLADNVEDVIWTFNLENQKFTYISPSIVKLRGYTVEEAMSQTLQESLSPEDFLMVRKEMEDRLNDYRKGKMNFPSHYRYEVQQPHKDGSMVWVEMNTNLVTDGEGHPKEIFGVSRDISERKIIAERIEENERQLSIIFNNAPAMMILINEKSEILKINHVGLKRVGIKKTGAINFKPGDVLKCINSVKTGKGCGSSDDCYNCQLKGIYSDTINRGTDHTKVEISLSVIEDENTVEIPVLISSSVVSDFPEVKILVTIDDITDRKKLENDLIRAKERAEESDRLKTSFLANISHEIRTPLNGVVGFSEIIADPSQDEGKRLEYGEIIKTSAQQLLSIVNNIMEISRVETGQVEIHKTEVDLNKLIDELSFYFNIEAEKKNLKFLVDKGLPDSKCGIFTDPVLLRKILENLTENALKFTDTGMITLAYTSENGIIQFTVEDTGIGIQKGMGEKIFERFIKLDRKDGRQVAGNGLGLSLSKAYSEKLGGRIFFEPCLPTGTRFIFEMPFADKRLVDKSPVSKETEIKHDPCIESTILVVEDEEINFIYAEQILKRLNAKILRAKTGKEAIAIVKNNDGIRLILMDIKLPDLSGYEVTKVIKSSFPDIKIVALTAYALAGDREAALEAGCIDYIAKPASSETMISVISRYC